ncbi:uncharacterized protein LOC134671868 [Cydia fagiglandana]|uniref:uncharacterized protein LOC134671868 n=1 Tax=Cydia fagiglandana TaxID=1458189 RepID=UPI002FEE086E
MFYTWGIGVKQVTECQLFRNQTMPTLMVKELLVITMLIVTCSGGAIKDWFHNVAKSETPVESRGSMSDALVNYLDYIFPKDDWTSTILKRIFMLFTADNMFQFSSEFVGLGENW